MSKRLHIFIYWIPRVLSILMILMLFSLSLDVIGPSETFLSILLSLFMHNIFVIVLTILFIIGWKNEWALGLLFTLATLYIFTMTWVYRGIESIKYSLILIIPGLIISLLYIFEGFYKKSIH